MLTTVLLDVDGTLIDSNDAHAESWTKAFNNNGIEVSFGRIRPLIGMGGDQILEKIAGLKEDSAQAKAITKDRKKIFFSEHLPHLKPFRGTRELVTKLKHEGLDLVVASSSGGDQLNELLIMAGVEDLLELRTSKDDAENSKPAPDIILAALEKAGASPKQALMIGDTPYDIEAARQAGVNAVAFLTGGWKTNDLRGAIAIYEGPEELVLNFQTSKFVRHQFGYAELTQQI